MKRTPQKYEDLESKIMDALTLLDEKGTNDNVTRAMAIVCEGFRQHAAKRRFSAKDLFRSGNAALSCE